jgi:hypothetical protein
MKTKILVNASVYLMICILVFNACCKPKPKFMPLSSLNFIPKVGDVWVYRVQGIFAQPGLYDTVYLKAINNTVIGDTSFFKIIEVKNDTSNTLISTVGNYLVYNNGLTFRNNKKFFINWSNFIFSNSMQLGDELILPNPVTDTGKFIFTRFYPTLYVAGLQHNDVYEFTQISNNTIDTFIAINYFIKDTGLIYQDANREAGGLVFKNTMELIRFIRN